MKTTILIDNNAPEGLEAEWGFSALIEGDVTDAGANVADASITDARTNGSTDAGANGAADGRPPVKVLLDAGDSGIFVENAKCLGIDLADVDYAVLSHAHFDHSDGLEAFFETNEHAPLLIQASCAEDCYSDAKGELSYIGVKRGLLDEHASRIWRYSGVCEFVPGFWLVGHTPETAGRTAFDPHMFLKADGTDELAPDRFLHEQSLVVEAPSGLVVFNSCSHSGVELIIEEVRAAFPDQPIAALVGGLHLFTRSDEDVYEVADELDELGIGRIYTGHCTGERALEILREVLGDKVVVFESGLTFEA